MMRRASWSAAPVRIDLSDMGGSDLLEICAMQGARVVNLSARVNHSLVRTMVCPTPKIFSVQASIDGQQETYRTAAELLDFNGQYRLLNLIKAAMQVAGIIGPEDESKDLQNVFAKFGGGFEIVAATDLPPRSGLGVADILAAVTLNALVNVTGNGPLTRNQLVQRVLTMQELLGTRRRFQDSIGGLFGGFKEITTPPGTATGLSVRRLSVTPGFLAEFTRRGFLVYTGPGNFQGNMWDEIVRDCLDFSDEAERRELNRIHGHAMEALKTEKFSLLGESMSRAWKIWKEIAPAANSEQIQAVFDATNQLIDGGKATGAGGGGCVFLLAKKGRTSALRNELSNLAGVDVLPFTMDFEGLSGASLPAHNAMRRLRLAPPWPMRPNNRVLRRR